MADTIEQKMQTFENALRDSGMRMTVQRREVYRELADTHEHLDAETVYQRVQERIPMISRDTVYRTLSMLEEQGLLSRVNLLTERARFDPDTGAHPHFVCRVCGKIEDLDTDLIDALDVPQAARALGKVETVHVNFRGVCNDCLEELDDEE